MEPRDGGRNHTPIKPPEDSFVTHKESDDLYLKTYKLEERVKGLRVFWMIERGNYPSCKNSLKGLRVIWMIERGNSRKGWQGL